jgi:hypothetical protein
MAQARRMLWCVFPSDACSVGSLANEHIFWLVDENNIRGTMAQA